MSLDGRCQGQLKWPAGFERASERPTRCVLPSRPSWAVCLRRPPNAAFCQVCSQGERLLQRQLPLCGMSTPKHRLPCGAHTHGHTHEHTHTPAGTQAHTAPEGERTKRIHRPREARRHTQRQTRSGALTQYSLVRSAHTQTHTHTGTGAHTHEQRKRNTHTQEPSTQAGAHTHKQRTGNTCLPR